MNFGLNKVTGTGKQTVEMLKHKTDDLEKKGVPGYTLLEETDPEFADYIEVLTREADDIKIYHIKKGNIAFYVEASWVLMTQPNGYYGDPEDDIPILQDKTGEDDTNYLEYAVGTVEKVGEYNLVTVGGTYDVGFGGNSGIGEYLEFYLVEDDAKTEGEPVFYKR